jgi:hypothetical protein
VSLGNCGSWKESYSTQRFDEMKKLRSRNSGNISCSGFIAADTNISDISTRRTALELLLGALRIEVNGGSTGQLTYGEGGDGFFDKIVKVDSFSAEINQAVNQIDWSLEFSYTEFPNEDSFAAAEFKVDTNSNYESGDHDLMFSGKISAGTELIALSKLASIQATILAANGFNEADLIKVDTGTEFINSDDSEQPTNPGTFDNVFTVLSFSRGFRRRIAADLMTWTMMIDDKEDQPSGLVTRTYSGSILASGVTADSAYAAANTKARELGDNKHDFRLSGSVSRNDRQVGATADKQMISLDFSFSYKIKGNRIWAEYSVSDSSDRFQLRSLKVSGFVVARTKGEMVDAYNDIVRTGFNGEHITNEETSTDQNKVGRGTHGEGLSQFTDEPGFDSLVTRFSFSFELTRDRAPSEFAFNYTIARQNNYSERTSKISVSGNFVSSPAEMAAAATNQAGNRIDTLLTGLGFDISKRTNSSRQEARQDLGANSKTLGIQFTEAITSTLSGAAQIVRTSVTDAIEHSGIRWVPGPIPGGYTIMQDTGIKEGKRTISGSVVATTEAVAMAWVEKQRSLTFPVGVGGGTPSVRYVNPPRITRSFDFIPFDELIARGAGANAVLVKISFEWSEWLPNYAYVS